jgi:hypothetical protein
MKYVPVIAIGCAVDGSTINDVEVLVYDFDFAHSCWCAEPKLLDGDLWEAYANSDENVCTWQLQWTAATVDGECISTFNDCGGIPEDPWLVACETVTGCCELDVLSYQLCRDVGVACDGDTGSAVP